MASKILEKANKEGALTNLEFANFVHDSLVSNRNYVLDVASQEQVNGFVASKLAEKIQKHPLIWKLFFKIC